MSGGWLPTHADPLFILAMDQRDSFEALFGVTDDRPTSEQDASMVTAKNMIFQGFLAARDGITTGRPGVLTDEQFGFDVIAGARGAGVELAVPIEASGQDWFTLQWGDEWADHVTTIGPQFAKVLVRDNPGFDADRRAKQLADLAEVSAGLRDIGVPFLYELLVPATDAQKERAGADPVAYDRDVRPELVVRVIADNYAAGVEPTLWKIEGLETVEAARAVAAAARAGERTASCIVLGRDAPKDRLDHWLAVAAQVEEFVGFAIGRSNWQDVVVDWHRGTVTDDDAVAQIAANYTGFVDAWLHPAEH